MWPAARISQGTVVTVVGAADAADAADAVDVTATGADIVSNATADSIKKTLANWKSKFI
jgi:hypothetical protein